MVVAAIIMVVLVLIIRRHRAVAHQMWMKMVVMESEIDRLRGLLGPNTVQMSCACKFEPAGYKSKGVEYVDYLTERMIYDLAMKMTQELTCYMRPLVLQGLGGADGSGTFQGPTGFPARGHENDFTKPRTTNNEVTTWQRNLHRTR